MSTSDTQALPAASPGAPLPRSVVLVTPLWSRHGGVATHVQASAAALAQRGVQVRVLAARVDPSEDVPGVSVAHRPALANPDVDPLVRVGETISQDTDVVHLHQLDDPALVASLRRRAPVAISVHGYSACPSGVYYFRPGHECTRSHGRGCIPNLILRGCAHMRDPRPLPRAYQRAGEALRALLAADLTISYSSAVDRHLAANSVLRRTVLPLFTTMSPRTGSGHAERRRVVFAGRVVAAKGVGVLIRAIADLDCELVVCGEGWQLEAMRALARRVGADSRVRFTGWLAAEQLAQELADASVVAMPSLWPEPFGLVGIEALAAGRPVIASATGGVGDWLRDGVSGLTVAPGDRRGLALALERLLADPQRQGEMGEAGRRSVAERFTVARHVSALADAYARAREHWAQTLART